MKPSACFEQWELNLWSKCETMSHFLRNLTNFTLSFMLVIIKVSSEVSVLFPIWITTHFVLAVSKTFHSPFFSGPRTPHNVAIKNRKFTFSARGSSLGKEKTSNVDIFPPFSIPNWCTLIASVSLFPGFTHFAELISPLQDSGNRSFIRRSFLNNLTF